MNSILGQTLQTALAHHQAGRLEEAKTLYDAILTAQPGQPDALHFLGLLACQLKQYDAGIALMEQSLVERPDASYFNNLGNMLRESGRLDDAITHYRRAVGLRPDYPEAHNNLGNALRDAREPAAAMESCARALELRPGYAEAYNNLGNALQDLGDLDGAATHYGRAIELDPSMAMAHANLSAVRHKQLRCAEALAHAQDAIRLAPTLAEAHNHAGNAYHGLDRLDEAQASHRTAVSLNPADAGACHNLSVVLLKLQRLDEALVYCRQALQAGPPAVLMHVNLGDILRAQGNVDAAVHAYRDALALVRDDADDVAATVLNRLLFSAAASACVTPPTTWPTRGATAGTHARSTRHAHDPRERAARAQGRPLRVGFVSGDLRLHPVGIFLESVLAHLERTRIDLRVYVTTDEEDAITAKLKPHASGWRSIAALGPDAAARMIHDDEIDVLVDLAGHTQSSGLAVFGWKPAPVQASWLGFSRRPAATRSTTSSATATRCRTPKRITSSSSHGGCRTASCASRRRPATSRSARCRWRRAAIRRSVALASS